MAAYSSQVISLFVLLWYCSTFQTSGTSGVFPFGRSTCVLSALPTSPWSDHPRNRPPFTAPCTLSENVVGVVPFPFSNLFLYLELYPVILRLFHLVVADSRATARTTNPFSHAASIKKCTRSAWSRSPTRRQHQLARMIMVAQTIPRRRIGNIFPCRCRNKKRSREAACSKRLEIWATETFFGFLRCQQSEKPRVCMWFFLPSQALVQSEQSDLCRIAQILH